MLATGLILIVALLHCWFLVLEMFLWTKPLGMKTMRLTPEAAQSSKVLAMNQGLYNGFLAAGLFASLIFSDPAVASSFKFFFLICVVIAGIYGGVTANFKIIYIQALPAALALMALFY